MAGAHALALALTVRAVVALPLVLPPTVLGFYLLVALGPNGPGGQLTQALGMGLLPFTFGGLLLGSVIYSLPFVVQPLQHAFEAIGTPADGSGGHAARRPLDAFFTVACRWRGRLSSRRPSSSFAHTVGEFGVVLMIGGNIPNQTRVVSTQIYGHVEALEYHTGALARGRHAGCSLSWCCWRSRC